MNSESRRNKRMKWKRKNTKYWRRFPHPHASNWSCKNE